MYVDLCFYLIWQFRYLFSGTCIKWYLEYQKIASGKTNEIHFLRLFTWRVLHHHTYNTCQHLFFLHLWLFKKKPVAQMNNGRYWMKASISFTSVKSLSLPQHFHSVLCNIRLRCTNQRMLCNSERNGIRWRSQSLLNYSLH